MCILNWSKAKKVLSNKNPKKSKKFWKKIVFSGGFTPVGGFSNTYKQTKKFDENGLGPLANSHILSLQEVNTHIKISIWHKATEEETNDFAWFVKYMELFAYY